MAWQPASVRLTSTLLVAAGSRSCAAARSSLIFMNILVLLHPLDEADRLGRHRLLAANRPLPFAAFDFNVDTHRLHAHRLGQSTLDSAEVWPQPRWLGVDDRVHID